MKKISDIHASSRSKLPEIFYPLNERDLDWYYMYIFGGISDVEKSRYDVVQDILDMNSLGCKNSFFSKADKINKIVRKNIDEKSSLISSDSIMIYFKKFNVLNNVFWVKKNQRATLFLSLVYLFMINKSKEDIYLFHIQSDLRHQAVILYFDAIFFNQHDRKFLFVEDLYYFFKSNITSSTDLIWLNKKDNIQLDWAWDYMVKSELIMQFDEFNPATYVEKYSMIVAALDFLGFYKNYDFIERDGFEPFDKDKRWSKKEFLIKFKKAWQQKNRRKIARSTQKKISRE